MMLISVRYAVFGPVCDIVTIGKKAGAQNSCTSSAQYYIVWSKSCTTFAIGKLYSRLGKASEKIV